MPTVKVNFGDVEDFAALPEGVYEAVVAKIEYREAKEKGKAPYLNVEYTVTEPEEYAERKVWEVLSWAPKALFRMRDFFRAAGFEDDEYDLDIDEESNLLIEPDLEGEAVTLTIENEMYNKQERNRVVVTEFASPPGLSETEEVEEEEEADVEEEEVEEEEDDTEEEEEEEEEEPAPAPKKKVAPKAAPAKVVPKAPVKATPVKKVVATTKKRTFR